MNLYTKRRDNLWYCSRICKISLLQTPSAFHADDLCSEYSTTSTQKIPQRLYQFEPLSSLHESHHHVSTNQYLSRDKAFIDGKIGFLNEQGKQEEKKRGVIVLDEQTEVNHSEALKQLIDEIKNT